MRNNKSISNTFDFIEVAIDLDNKLYKRAIKKQYNQFYKKAKIFFELTTKYQQREFCSNQKYNNLDYCKSISIELKFI